MKVQLLLISSLLLVSPAYAEELPRREISVQGQASRVVAPDQVDVTLSVEGRAKDAGEAMNMAGEHSQGIIDAMLEFVTKRQLRALQTQVREVVRGTTRSWRRDSSEPMEVLASRQIRIQSVSIEMLPDMMRAMSQHTFTRIEQVLPKVSTAAKIEDEILLLAVDDAKQRATKVASRLGVTLGPPISVSVQNHYAPKPQLEMRMMAVQADAGGGYDAIGENEIRAGVSIRFELETD